MSLGDESQLRRGSTSPDIYRASKSCGLTSRFSPAPFRVGCNRRLGSAYYGWEEQASGEPLLANRQLTIRLVFGSTLKANRHSSSPPISFSNVPSALKPVPV